MFRRLYERLFKRKPDYRRIVIYDLTNEHIMFVDENTPPLTNEQMRNNWVVMPIWQAKAIRDAKGLPMPFIPPPSVNFKENSTC